MKEHFNLFDTTDQVVVYNPTEEDFRFVVGGEREYEVKSKQFKLLHGSAGRLYVKKMCDYYHINNNQIENINNKSAEELTAKQFVKRVINDNIDLSEKELEALIKATKTTDTVEAQASEPKPMSQTEAILNSAKKDTSPITETAFPDIVAKK